MENPALLDDSEYPEWVFSLVVRGMRQRVSYTLLMLPALVGATTAQEGKLATAEMELEGVDKYPLKKQIQYANIKHREVIKSSNSALAN